MSEELNAAMGALIRRRRETVGMSQTSLAEALDLSRTSVTNIERGRQPISVKHLYDAARALGLKPHELLPEDPAQGAGRTGRRTDEIDKLLGLLSADRGAAR